MKIIRISLFITLLAVCLWLSLNSGSLALGMDLSFDTYNTPIISNLHDTRFTVFWLTKEDSVSEILYGTNPDSVNLIAYDSYKQGVATKVHYVKVNYLLPDTRYYFDLVNNGQKNDNQGLHYSCITGPILSTPSPGMGFGQVFSEDLYTPANGAIVFISLSDQDGFGSPGESALISCQVSESDNYWYINLASVRTKEGMGYFNYSTTSDHIYLQAILSKCLTGELSLSTSQASDAPALYLNYLEGCIEYLDLFDYQELKIIPEPEIGLNLVLFHIIPEASDYTSFHLIEYFRQQGDLITLHTHPCPDIREVAKTHSSCLFFDKISGPDFTISANQVYKIYKK